MRTHNWFCTGGSLGVKTAFGNGCAPATSLKAPKAGAMSLLINDEITLSPCRCELFFAAKLVMIAAVVARLSFSDAYMLCTRCAWPGLLSGIGFWMAFASVAIRG